MQCPSCAVDLVMSERQGIEIDYCPKCRGVWLDRGELDKIIERSAQAPATAPPTPTYAAHPPQHPSQHAPRRHYDDDDHYRKKKRGWLGELFD